MKVKVGWHFLSFALFQKVQRLCFFSCSFTSSFLPWYPQTTTKPKITFSIDCWSPCTSNRAAQLTSLNRRRQSSLPCERLDKHYFYVCVHVSDIDAQSVGAGKSIIWPVNIWGDQNTCLPVKVFRRQFLWDIDVGVFQLGSAFLENLEVNEGNKSNSVAVQRCYFFPVHLYSLCLKYI